MEIKRGVEDGRYGLVINHEEQYSLWPPEQEPPPGWKLLQTGTLQECETSLRKLVARSRTGI